MLQEKKGEVLQYATFYYLRLSALKPMVIERAELKWKGDKKLQFHKNILDIKPNHESVICGTLFKEMPLKPCILKNLLGVLGTRKFSSGMYVHEDDYCILEDQ